MNGRVLVMGSSCVDVIIRLDHLPVTEENMHPSGQEFRLGGCACNAANILGRGGADTRFITPVGLEGVFGPFVLRALKNQPWARPVPLPGKENGCCYCLVEKSGERTFMGIHGTEYAFDPAWMAPYENEAFDYGYVCGLEVEESCGDALVSWLEGAPIGKILYAPSPRGSRVPRERTDRLFALRPLLHLNQREAYAMAGTDDLYRAARALHSQTNEAVIVTLGAEGALVLDSRGRRLIPGERVTRVADTIGAGDAHAGAVLLGLSRGQSLDEAVALANRVAARVVQTPGATLSDESLREALK